MGVCILYWEYAQLLRRPDQLKERFEKLEQALIGFSNAGRRPEARLARHGSAKEVRGAPFIGSTRACNAPAIRTTGEATPRQPTGRWIEPVRAEAAAGTAGFPTGA